jgi:hypothetical protein
MKTMCDFLQTIPEGRIVVVYLVGNYSSRVAPLPSDSGGTLVHRRPPPYTAILAAAAALHGGGGGAHPLD